MPTESETLPAQPVSPIFDFQGDSTPAAETSPPLERDPSTGRFLKAGFSASIVREAREHGIDDADLAGMSVAEVKREIRDAKRDRYLEQQLALAQRARDGAGPAQTAAQTTAEPTEAAKFDHGVSADDWDPKLVAVFDKMRDHYDARIKALEEQVGGVKQFAEGEIKQRQESFARRVEKVFAKHPHIFGTGPIDKLDKDSPEFDFRMAAVKAYRKAGSSPDELEDTIEQFVASRFAGKPAAPAEDADDAGEIARWEAGVTARPTQRGHVPTPPSKEKAVADVKRALNGTMPAGRVSKTNRDTEFPG